MRKPGIMLVEAENLKLQLAGSVHVDLREATALAHRLVRDLADPTDLSADWSPLAGELLPDWYDDWVVLERELFRQLGLNALERLSERLAESRMPGPALEVALAVVAGEPFRESAHRVLIKAHLASGNKWEAIRQYRFYTRLLHDHLNLDPSPAMTALIEGVSMR
jgi:DNA-binding SARP family transcriptional activator